MAPGPTPCSHHAHAHGGTQSARVLAPGCGIRTLHSAAGPWPWPLRAAQWWGQCGASGLSQECHCPARGGGSRNGPCREYHCPARGGGSRNGLSREYHYPARGGGSRIHGKLSPGVSPFNSNTSLQNWVIQCKQEHGEKADSMGASLSASISGQFSTLHVIGSKRLHLSPSFHLPCVIVPGGQVRLPLVTPMHPSILITIHHEPPQLPAPPGPSCGRPRPSVCLCSSISLQPMASEHGMGADTKKLALVAKGVNRSAIVLFC